MSKDLLKNKKKAELLEIIERQSNAIGALVDKLEALNAKNKILSGQLAEYHAALLVQKNQIHDLETRLEVYRK